MTAREQQGAASQYELVARYLRTLMCAVCGGRAHRGAAKCGACKGTGFRDGHVHLMVSAAQVRR